ncbi:WD40-repeat-containing domain protein [Baffinella frigidus]|nr:WD40-repeat-containing domain protein [Cryptophyta sp. CCMP2293]
MFQYDLVTRREISRDPNPVRTPLFDVAFRNNETVSAVGMAGSLYVRSTATGELLASIKTGPAFSLAWRDEGVCAVGAINGSIKLVKYPTGEVLHTFLGHQHGQVYSVRFFDDRRTLVSGGADGSIRVWDTHWDTMEPPHGGEVFKLVGHKGPVFRVCCVPGATVAAGTPYTLNPEP